MLPTARKIAITITVNKMLIMIMSSHFKRDLSVILYTGFLLFGIIVCAFLQKVKRQNSFMMISFTYRLFHAIIFLSFT